MKKNKILILASGLLLMTSFLVLVTQKKEMKSIINFENENEEEDESEEEDGMREAMLQEIKKTKDPALGYVPKERLYESYLYAQSLLKTQNQQRTSAAISGITWTERGPSNIGGRTRAILVDKNDATKKTVWAAGVGGGLWKTTDITVASPVWVTVNDFFNNIAITTIAQDPTNPNIMYFGTGEGFFNTDAIVGNGIWKSIDGGVTWTQLANTVHATLVTHFYYVQKIVVNSSGKIFAATSGYYSNYGGLMMSSDGGTTWTRYNGNGVSPDAACDVEIASNGDVYTSFNIGGSDGIYKSTNAGTSWTNVYSDANANRIELACAPNNSSTVYAMLEDAGTGGILSIIKTTNAGTSWSTCNLPNDADLGIGSEITRGQAWYDLALAVDPNADNTLIAGGVDLFRSTDGGSTWSQISKWSNNANMNTLSCSTVHADQHAITYIPGSSSSVLFGNDGGIFYTTSVNTAATSNVITNKNTGYNVTQFYACAAHPASGSNYYLAGAQDNGTQKFNTTGLGATTSATGGDGAFCHIDQDNSAYQFTAYTYQTIYRSTNGGTSFSAISNGSNGSFINPSDYDNTGNNLYAADAPGSYFRILNAIGTYTSSAISIANFSGGNVSHVMVSPNVSNRVYFGIDNGRIVKVDNANATPTSTNLGAPVSGGNVSCVAVGKSDDTLMVTYSNYGVTSIFYTTNGTSATPTWTSIEGNLPDMPVRWAMFWPTTSKKALIATELGVWSTDNINGASTNWGPTNTGLANVRTDMLQYRSSDQTLVAATHGRGLYTSSIASLLPITWTSFTGETKKSYNHLKWTTASEFNNDYFEVQRSENALDFYGIGKIKGSGTTYQAKEYEFDDNSIKNNIYYYYRIKQVDYDGKYDFSKVISLQNKFTNGWFNVFPNPAKETLNIDFNNDVTGEINITIYDITGKMVYSKQTIAIQQKNLTLENESISLLPTGTYYLRLDINGEVYSSRFIKI